MKIFIKSSLFLPLLLADINARADDFSPIPDSLTVVQQRSPIPFVPFSLVDPASGRPVIPDTILNLPTGKVQAGRYYTALNNMEEGLNKLGYSLRNQADLGVISHLDVDMGMIARQVQGISEKLRKFENKIMAAIQEGKEFEAVIKAKLNDFREKALQRMKEIALANGVSAEYLENPTIDDKLIKYPNKDLKSITHKEWNFDAGEAKTVMAHGEAVLYFGVSLKESQALAKAKLSGAFLDNPFDLMYAHAEIKNNNAKVDSEDGKKEDVNAALTADIYLDVLGQERIQWKKNKTWKVASIGKDEEKQEPVQDSKPWTLGPDPIEYKWRFMVGPIPCSALIGVAAQLQFNWGTNFSPTYAGLYTEAGGHAKMYAFGGFDAELVKGGAYADLEIFRQSYRAEGSLNMNFDKGQPNFKVEVKGTKDIHVLTGKVGARAEYPVPKAGIPPYEMKNWSYSIFDWKGHHDSGVLFNFVKEIGLSGEKLTGAPTAEDLGTVRLDQEYTSHFEKVVRDAQSQALVAESKGKASMEALEASKARFDSWIKSLH